MKKLFLPCMPVCLLLALLMLAGLTACQSAGKKAGEKAAEAAIEKASGEKTDVDIDGNKVTIEGEGYKAEVNTGGNTWPEEIPDGVPEFAYGQIDGITTTETDDLSGWGINYRNVPKEAVEKYDAELKNKGFKTVKIIMGEGSSVSGEKDNLAVSVISGQDMTHVSVQVTK